jgi:xylan 1,4-beta-xylosidase
VQGSRTPKAASVQRVDDAHCNSRQAWQDMGAPGYLDARQIAELDQASQLESGPVAVTPHDDGFDLRLDLPPHGIAAVRVELAA